MTARLATIPARTDHRLPEDVSGLWNEGIESLDNPTQTQIQHANFTQSAAKPTSGFKLCQVPPCL